MGSVRPDEPTAGIPPARERSGPDEETREFAAEVIAVLDLQKAYFDARRKGLPDAARLLDESKAAERALRRRALELRGVAPGGLF